MQESLVVDCVMCGAVLCAAGALGLYEIADIFMLSSSVVPDMGSRSSKSTWVLLESVAAWPQQYSTAAVPCSLDVWHHPVPREEVSGQHCTNRSRTRTVCSDIKSNASHVESVNPGTFTPLPPPPPSLPFPLGPWFGMPPVLL